MSKKITKKQLDPAFVADLVLESEKGMPNGVPSLDTDGKVPLEQLPEGVSQNKINGKLVTFRNLQDNDTLRYDVLSDTFKNAAQNLDRTPPGDVTAMSISAGNGFTTLKWSDPTDADWFSTTLVRKVGSYPTSISDGTTVIVLSNKNQYSSSGFVDSNLTNDTQYYYQLFPQDLSGNINKNTTNRLTAMPVSYVEYGVFWNRLNGTATRLGAGVGLSPGANFSNKYPWQDVRRCTISDSGSVLSYYGDPTYKEDGSNGQAMVEIPKFWFKKVTVSTGFEFWIADSPAPGYTLHPAFYRDRGTGTSVEVSKRYIGTYLGYVNGTKLESKINVTPTVSNPISTFRSRAEARGSGWGIFDFNLLFAIQILYLVEYSSMDSQTAIGQGYVGSSSPRSTGGTSVYGNSTYGSTSSTTQVSYRGIEDIWGNLNLFIDGLYANSNRDLLIGNRAFNDTGSGYTKTVVSGVTSDNSGFISDIIPDPFAGFAAKTISGSSSTGLYDWGGTYANCMPVSGGAYNDGSYGGMFFLNINRTASYTGTFVGTRLAY